MSDELEAMKSQNRRFAQRIANMSVASNEAISQAVATAKEQAWNEGYRAGWDDRNEDEVNSLPAGAQHDTPNPYKKEEFDGPG